jgi:hypothetical protein
MPGTFSATFAWTLTLPQHAQDFMLACSEIEALQALVRYLVPIIMSDVVDALVRWCQPICLN